MIHRASVSVALGLLDLALAGSVRARAKVQPSQGRHSDHTWRIDKNHLIVFKMKPSVEAAQQEVRWMAKHREEILRQTMAEARTPPAIPFQG